MADSFEVNSIEVTMGDGSRIVSGPATVTVLCNGLLEHRPHADPEVRLVYACVECGRWLSAGYVRKAIAGSAHPRLER